MGCHISGKMIYDNDEFCILREPQRRTKVAEETSKNRININNRLTLFERLGEIAVHTQIKWKILLDPTNLACAKNHQWVCPNMEPSISG